MIDIEEFIKSNKLPLKTIKSKAIPEKFYFMELREDYHALLVTDSKDRIISGSVFTSDVDAQNAAELIHQLKHAKHVFNLTAEKFKETVENAIDKAIAQDKEGDK